MTSEIIKQILSYKDKKVNKIENICMKKRKKSLKQIFPAKRFLLGGSVRFFADKQDKKAKCNLWLTIAN